MSNQNIDPYTFKKNIKTKEQQAIYSKRMSTHILGLGLDYVSVSAVSAFGFLIFLWQLPLSSSVSSATIAAFATTCFSSFAGKSDIDFKAT